MADGLTYVHSPHGPSRSWPAMDCRAGKQGERQPANRWFSLRCKDEAFCVTSALWSFFTLQLVQAPLTGCTPTGWGPVVVYSHTHTHVCRYTHPVHTCEHTNMLAHTHTRTHMHTRTDMHTSKNIKLGLRGVRSPALLRGNYGRKLVTVKKYIWLVEYFWN